MSNPMFDDFIELDLLDPSEASSDDMFSYYLGDTTDLDSNTDLASALAASSSVDDMNMALDLAIKQDSTADSISSQMLLDPSSSSTSPTISTADPTLTIVSADQLTFTPQQVTTISPSTISLSTVAPSSLSTESSIASPSKQSSSAVSTAAAVVGTKNVQKSVASKALSSVATKRSSPEPVTPARKHAKTESVSKSKSSAASARKSSTASSTSSSAAAAAASSTTAASKTMSSSRSTASTASNSMTESPISTAALMSPINTTLSPATLQFLIQQQGETPLIPQLFTGKLSREEIEATLARLLESTKHLIAPLEEEPLAQVKEEPASDEESDDGMEGMEANEAIGMEQTHGLKTQPGIKTDDIPSSTDLKKMTSKERRQLRNKISARNFRVRRKEGQVLQHKTEARHLREAVTLVQEENQRLKDELELVRCQLAETTLATNGSVMAADCQEALQPTGCTGVTPLSKENQSLLTSIMNRNVSSALNPNAKSNLMLSMGRPQSPILTPNLHKDVPNSSSGSTGQSSWKDKNPIMVHTTLVPEICFGEEFQFGDKVAKSNEDDMVDRPWMRLQEQSKAQEMPKTFNPFWVSGVVFELMQTFVGMAMNMVAPETDGLVEVVATSSEELVVLDEIESEEEDEIDWELQQSLWAATEQEDEGEMTEEQIQLLYDLSQLQLSDIRPSSPTLVSQEDPNMLEWLYESMMARLVDLDLQSTQDHSYGPMTDSRSA